MSDSPRSGEPADRTHEAALHVEVHGRGAPGLAPLLLVHGVLDSARGFSRVVRKLDGRRLAVTYDRRGYQRSRAAGATPPVLADHVEDLLHVAASRAPGAVVLGHSYGGVVALAAAQRRPDLVAAVLAYEPPLSWLSWWPLAAAAGEAASDGPSPSPGAGETTYHFAERFMRTMIGDRRYERLGESTRRGLGEDGVAAVSELVALERAAAFDPAAITVPVLVVRGAHTADRHVRGTTYLAGAIPGAELRVVHGADHGGHLSHPGELAALLEELAERVDTSGGAGGADVTGGAGGTQVG